MKYKISKETYIMSKKTYLYIQRPTKERPTYVNQIPTKKEPVGVPGFPVKVF